MELGHDPTPAPRPADLLGRFGLLERALLRGWVGCVAASDRAALGLRIAAVDADHDVVACDAIPHLVCNRVAGPGLTRQADVARAVATLRAAGKNHAVVLGPGATADALEGSALVPFRRDSLVLVRGAEARGRAAAPCRIERVDHRHRGAAAELVADGFALPAVLAAAWADLTRHAGWHGYVAFDGGTAVAVGLMGVVGHDAYLAGGVTRASARGRGIHDAIIGRRIEVARALGVRRVFVDTGTPVEGEASPSLQNLRAAGFVPVAVRRQLVAPGSTWTGVA